MLSLVARCPKMFPLPEALGAEDDLTVFVHDWRRDRAAKVDEDANG